MSVATVLRSGTDTIVHGEDCPQVPNGTPQSTIRTSLPCPSHLRPSARLRNTEFWNVNKDNGYFQKTLQGVEKLATWHSAGSVA